MAALCRLRRIAVLQTRENNSNWKGGKSITAHGYVIIRVGIGHHLADVRGYAYEHRLVAEQMLGRRLKPGEIVHHRDGKKQHNDPGNLFVAASIADHLVHHRVRSDRRLPGELNPEISCACGCGKAFSKYDTSGRPRRYVSGHNIHPRRGGYDANQNRVL